LRFTDPDFYHGGGDEAVARVLKRRGELAPQVEALEAAWLKVSEQLESVS
jgi:hypothetical protein